MATTAKQQVKQGASKIDIVIPARLASSRLPDKVLLPDASGVPLIGRVVAAAKAYRQQHVASGTGPVVSVHVLASRPDFSRLADFGIGGVVTNGDHENGMSRVAEFVDGMILPFERPGGLIVHLQADEPEITPEHIATLVDRFLEFPACDVATLSAVGGVDDFDDPNTVKVRSGEWGFAAGFSRTGKGDRHIGVYAYRPGFALWHQALEPSDEERRERLEQLRTHGRGARFRVFCVKSPGPRGIDTQADYEAFLERDRIGVA